MELQCFLLNRMQERHLKFLTERTYLSLEELFLQVQVRSLQKAPSLKKHILAAKKINTSLLLKGCLFLYYVNVERERLKIAYLQLIGVQKVLFNVKKYTNLLTKTRIKSIIIKEEVTSFTPRIKRDLLLTNKSELICKTL